MGEANPAGKTTAAIYTRKRLLIIISIVIIILIIIFLVVRSLNAPASGTIIQNPTSGVDKLKTTMLASTHYSDAYISFTYPGSFKPAPSQKSGTILDQVTLVDTVRHTGELISVGIYKENFASESGITFRKEHPEKYQIVTNTPEKIIFKNKGGSAEYTGFMTHKDLVLSLSLSSYNSSDLSQDYNSIAKSLTWKQ